VFKQAMEEATQLIHGQFGGIFNREKFGKPTPPSTLSTLCTFKTCANWTD